METALPVSPEAAAALLAISEKDGLGLDVSVNGLQATSGASMGVRAGVRGAEQSGVRGGVRGVMSRTRKPSRSPSPFQGEGVPSPRRGEGQGEEVSEISAEVSFQLQTNQPVTIPSDVLIAAKENPPVQPQTDLFSVVKKPLIQLSVRPTTSPETRLIESKVSMDLESAAAGGMAAAVEPTSEEVKLVDTDGNGVSTLVETAVLVTKGVPLAEAVQIASDPQSELKPTVEEIKEAYTVMAAKLEEKVKEDLKAEVPAGVQEPEVVVAAPDITPPDTSVTSSAGGDGAAVTTRETITFTFTCNDPSWPSNVLSTAGGIRHAVVRIRHLH